MRTRILIVAAITFATQLAATGHFEHESGQSGDWRWTDVQGMYSTHTNGERIPGEHFNVFCNDPDSLGGIRFQISVQGDQIGNHRMTLAFDDGTSIDVIGYYGSVSAEEAIGKSIIANVMANLRDAGSVTVTKVGAPPARFSLRGSSAVLARCP